ncbi:MAG: hypothetical protein EOP06_04565 [Proteobacteria bacterium]|nr:MAG: hypothetical protein EOP06_04565 [Pseudomonadota bacterium]
MKRPSLRLITNEEVVKAIPAPLDIFNDHDFNANKIEDVKDGLDPFNDASDFQAVSKLSLVGKAAPKEFPLFPVQLAVYSFHNMEQPHSYFQLNSLDEFPLLIEKYELYIQAEYIVEIPFLLSLNMAMFMPLESNPLFRSCAFNIVAPSDKELSNILQGSTIVQSMAQSRTLYDDKSDSYTVATNEFMSILCKRFWTTGLGPIQTNSGFCTSLNGTYGIEVSKAHVLFGNISISSSAVFFAKLIEKNPGYISLEQDRHGPKLSAVQGHSAHENVLKNILFVRTLLNETERFVKK